jgi:hypothetical protein
LEKHSSYLINPDKAIQVSNRTKIDEAVEINDFQTKTDLRKICEPFSDE